MRSIRWGGILLAGAVLGPVWVPATTLRMEPVNILITADVVVDGVQGPAGMAVHPLTGELYIAEEDGNRLSVVRDKQLHPALENGFEVSDDLPDWTVSRERPEPFWTRARFRRPCGVAFDADGMMYVVESGEGGRLLEFDARHEGQARARVLSTPWMQGDHGYRGLHSDAAGRLYVSVQKVDVDAPLPFGNVLLRERSGGWWMIDYGPFAEFAPPVSDSRGDFVVVGERRNADICWYDSVMQVCIASVESIAGLRHIALLPSGTTVAALEKQDGTWSLVEVDPRKSVLREWVGDLTAIGSMAVPPGREELYVSLPEEGRVLRVRPSTRAGSRENVLLALHREFRREHDVPPSRWPSFFRDFVDSLGVVEPVDRRDHARDARRRSVTLGEFAEAVPLIAAKVKATLVGAEGAEPDPVEEVSFLLYYPNESMLTQQTLAPSLSLFCARRASGRRSLSRFLPSFKGGRVTPETKWEDMPAALICFPSGYHATSSPVADPELLRVYYVDIGTGPDYLIDIHRSDPGKNRMTVTYKDDRKAYYELETFPEPDAAGGRSVLVADRMVRETGWYEIEDYPIMWKLIVDEPEQLNLRHAVRLEDLPSRDIHIGAGLADDFEREAVRGDLAWRRELIKQSIARWSHVHF